MEKFEVALLILGEVLEQRIPFNIATKNIFNKENIAKSDRGEIAGLVGCELRHHILFLEIVKTELGFQGEFNSAPILLAMANHLFYKKFDQNEINKFVCNRFDLSLDKFTGFLDNLSSRESLVPEKYPKGSEQYLSLRFNTPTWLVKMWLKHYGRGFLYKILKSNYRQPTPTFTYIGDINYISLPSDFVIEDDLVKYVGQGNVRSQELYNNERFILFKPALKEIIKNTEIHPYSNVAIFEAFSSNFYLDFIYNNLENHLNIEAITSSVSLYMDMKKRISAFNFPNVNLYEANPGEFITCLSEKVDLFVLLPKNSNFDLLKTTPDYFHLFERNTLDMLISEQIFALEEAKECVNVGGQILYIIPTLNKKESRQVIMDFLLNNPTFSLLEERQYFPFEKGESSLYFARLVKMENDDD